MPLLCLFLIQLAMRPSAKDATHRSPTPIENIWLDTLTVVAMSRFSFFRMSISESTFELQLILVCMSGQRNSGHIGLFQDWSWRSIIYGLSLSKKNDYFHGYFVFRMLLRWAQQLNFLFFCFGAFASSLARGSFRWARFVLLLTRNLLPVVLSTMSLFSEKHWEKVFRS